MRYRWESVGDQDKCVRKVCMLGVYLLEHVEDHWRGHKMMMVSRIWFWNKDHYDLVEELAPVEYERDKSYTNAEDWYGENVLFEKLFLGDEDEAD